MLFSLFLKKDITQETFLQGYFPNGIVAEEQYIEYLENVIDRKNAEEFDECLHIILVVYNLRSFAKHLCALLTMDWHYNHEDIARFLADQKLPFTVRCLHTAATMTFGYLDYDDTYQFSRKCIKALAAIRNAEAIESLKQLAINSNQVIAGYARKELARLDANDE